MKKYLIFLITIISISCSKKIGNCQTENGFGKLQLGMSRNDFDTKFPGFKASDPNIGIFHFDSLKVSENIVLKKVELWFADEGLVQIEAENNPDLVNILKKQNGIVANEKIGDKEYIEFKTKSKDFACMYFKSRNEKPKLGFVNMKAMRVD